MAIRYATSCFPFTSHFPSVTTGFSFQQFQIDFQLSHPLFQQHPAVAARELVVKVVLVAVVIIQINRVRLRAALGPAAVGRTISPPFAEYTVLPIIRRELI